MKDLTLNGYSSKFIQQTVQPTQTPNKLNNNALGFTCIPYVGGVSEQVKRVLCNAGVQTAYKPMQSLGDIFGKPKDKQADSKIKGIVYKFECPDCPFTYIGESKKSWKSRRAEHKPGMQPEIKSPIKDHAETTGHKTSMDMLRSYRRECKIHTRDSSLNLCTRCWTKDQQVNIIISTNLHAISAVMQR